MLKLNLGCGREIKPDGWTNLDTWRKQKTIDWYDTQRPLGYIIEKMDVSQPWCYDDNTVDYITSEHMLEHIPNEKNLFALQEAHRVLKVGGVIRTIVPSKKFYEELRGKDDHPFVTKYNQLIMKRSNTHNLGNEISRRGLQGQGHVWVPTEKMLIDRHREAGFDEVKIVQYNESDHKVLNSIDLIDGLREMESIVCEAIKT